MHAPTALADKRVQRRGIAGSACAYEQAGAKELRRTAGALTEAEAAHDSGLAAVGAADARRRTFRCPQCALGCCVRVSHGSWLHAICVRTGEGAEQLGVVRGLSRGLITSAHRRHLVILDRIAWKRSARTQARALRGVKSGACCLLHDAPLMVRAHTSWGKGLKSRPQFRLGLRKRTDESTRETGKSRAEDVRAGEHPLWRK